MKQASIANEAGFNRKRSRLQSQTKLTSLAIEVCCIFEA